MNTVLIELSTEKVSVVETGVIVAVPVCTITPESIILTLIYTDAVDGGK